MLSREVAAAANRWLASVWAKPLVLLLGALPFVWLVAAAALDGLGANPAQALVRSTGDWTLRSLCVVLAVTPLRQALGLSGLARLRRMLGLWVYFYAVLHLLAYSGFDMGLDLADIARDIAKRPFIWVGFSAWALLTLLALTSWNGAIRALGAARWRRLHQAIYAVAGLAVLHFFWMRSGKNDFNEVWAYGVVLGALLAWRVRWWWRSRPARAG